jgi:hypothetical protein
VSPLSALATAGSATRTSFGPIESPLVSAAVNPFSDPVHIVNDRPDTATSTTSIGIGTRAIVARPFVPTLHDELKVFPGESVVVLQAFDDGWAQVRNERKESGLIPIDCFREKGENVPAFLASKRVSSFFQSGSLLI